METGILYLVATPIGNLKDMSERSINVLNEVDFIAAEDTRHTLKLLNHFGIKKNMISYFEHNKRERGEIIVSRILKGENCALVTDAGTPAISDPGEDLVSLCAERKVRVIPVPGPCAFVQALIVSGLPTGRFSFEGFLSVNKTSRLKHLEDIKFHTETLIFHEAPHKLKATLNDLYETLGNRKIALVKEITKIHEDVIRCTLEEAIGMFADIIPKGEYVIIVNGYIPTPPDLNITDEELILKTRALIQSGIDKKTAIKEIALKYGVQKRRIYNLLIEN